MTTSDTDPRLLAADELLADRYLLLATVPGPGPAVLWRAVDEVLARPVAVKVLPASGSPGRAAAEPFLAAAVRTGAVVHPGLARVYDATVHSRPGTGPDVVLVISEWVDGQPLDVLLAEGPLDPVAAVDLLRQATDALTSAHAGGLVHGRLQPGNLLVTSDGRVKLTDAAVGAAVHGAPVPDTATPAAVRADTRDLAAVLYALLTARWPGARDTSAGRLEGAPVSAGRPLRPRQLSAAVPRALDAVVVRALDPAVDPGSPLVTPAALSAAAEQAVGELRQQRAAAAAPRPPTRTRRLLPWGLVLLLLGGIGTTGWLLGLAVGDLPRRDGAVEAIVSTTSAPSPGAPAVASIDLRKLPVTDFDPPPGDGQENPDSVRNAVDKDPGTAWQTSTYSTSAFGGLKKGVGLLVDLGRSRTLAQVQVGFTGPGTAVELRVADTVAPTTADGFATVAAERAASAVATLRPAAGARGRYWLVWLTGLPRADRGYRVGISELRFS